MKRISFIAIAILICLLGAIYIRRIIHETVQTRASGQQFVVSLGDSVAAGAGLSGNSRAGACDAVPQAFPYLVGAQLHASVEQFACSGATVSATGSYSLTTKQYPQAKPFIANSYVLVTGGANDIGWLQALVACAQTTCSGVSLQPKIQTMQQNLTVLLAQIQRDKPAKLVVNSYYDLLQSGDTCFARAGITEDKIAFIHREAATLNGAIAAAARATHATLVPIDFSGHLLCDTTPWIQGLDTAAPLHPTVAGQQQIAKQDAAAITSGL